MRSSSLWCVWFAVHILTGARAFHVNVQPQRRIGCSSGCAEWIGTSHNTGSSRSPDIQIQRVRYRTQPLSDTKIKQTPTTTQLDFESIESSDGALSEGESPDTSFLNAESIAVLALLFCVTLVCALDRVAMSVAIIPMSAEFQYTEAVKGTISSMFSFGYMFGLIPAGILGSFASPKGVLATGVLLWSVAQALSPFAAYTSMNALYASRFCMGLAEAVTIPTVQNFVARWVPDSSRSAVLGVILSGLQVGNVVAYLVSPWLLDHYRWSGLFIGYGLVGALWVALWLPLARDSPTGAQAGTADIVTPIIVDDLNGVNDEAGLQMTDMAVVQTGLQETNKATASIVADDATIAGIKEERSIGAIIGSAGLANLTTPTESFDDGEMESITNDVDDVGMTDLKSSMQNIPWREIVSSKEVQAVAIAHSVQNFGLYINLAWLPTFFNERFGLSVEASSLSSVLPWVAGALMGPITGYAADRAMTQGVDRTLIRRVAQTFSLIVPAATLVTLSTSEDISSEKCILFFVLAVASAACCVAGFGSSVQDLCKSPKYVSVVYGITSAPAVLFGSLGVYLTGVVLDQTKSWSLVFQGTALIYVVGAIFYAMNYEARKIFD